MTKKHFLALSDGTIFYGKSAGAKRDCVGEAVFNTGMTGYQEVATDPSYAGQIVALTTAEVGNYGCNKDDMESRGLFLNGMILQGLNEPSNYRSEESFHELLERHNVPCLYDIDVRKLVIKLRSSGCMSAYIKASDDDITPEEAVKIAANWEGLDNQDYASKVTVDKPYVWSEEGDVHIVAYDFGIKYNILRMMAQQNMKVTVVPAHTTAEEVFALKPDGVFLSNGPADPQALTSVIEQVKIISSKLPTMGICLGHQLLAIAHGADCYRLKFGHHGCNHPVKNLIDGTVEITSQNHNFAIKPESLSSDFEITHINLNDNTLEGFRHKTLPIAAVQYHPEAAPGPNDSMYLFKTFRQLLNK